MRNRRLLAAPSLVFHQRDFLYQVGDLALQLGNFHRCRELFDKQYGHYGQKHKV